MLFSYANYSCLLMGDTVGVLWDQKPSPAGRGAPGTDTEPKHPLSILSPKQGVHEDPRKTDPADLCSS